MEKSVRTALAQLRTGGVDGGEREAGGGVVGEEGGGTGVDMVQVSPLTSPLRDLVRGGYYYFYYND